MGRLLDALLIWLLPSLALCASVQCRYGDRALSPGETFSFEQNCANHTCTCDPVKPTSMCQSRMIGCLDSHYQCYKANETANLRGPRGGPMRCLCQLAEDGTFFFEDCRTETCKDSRTGEEKKPGESVIHVYRDVTYACICAGLDGFKNCSAIGSGKNEGRCLDHASGKYVATGAPVTVKQKGLVLHCTCAGTSSYSSCRSETCSDFYGGEKSAGEKVTVRKGSDLYACDCLGVEGYKNCVVTTDRHSEGECLDQVSGHHVKVGAPVTTKQGITELHCICAGTNSYRSCRSVTCPDFYGGEKSAGEKVTVRNGNALYICDCLGVEGYKNCVIKPDDNQGRCLDHVSGKYVATGEPATTKQKDIVLHCTCTGTNTYRSCRSATCPDFYGGEKSAGEKVTVRNGNALYVCDCAGVQGYRNCAVRPDYESRGTCKDIDGRYANKGHRYRVKYGGVTYECVCDGNNKGKGCTSI